MPRGYDKAVGYVAFKLDNGEFRPGGTTFLTSMPADDLEGCHHLYWVTAQHVITQAEYEGVDGRAHIVVPGVSVNPRCSRPRSTRGPSTMNHTLT